ncbi:phytanoyl-CoA dioxygenase family protein [Actinospongicola halichondriae]|uniref:phytanoyl-CoA dioxygenase family protein n=1 Tax=Actinospongicola halichondriae TaxID=3236844 RepID=UPI003D3E4696
MRTLTDADADRHADAIAEAGFTIVKDAFDPAFAQSVLDELDRIIDERGVSPADNGFEGRDTYRVYNLLVHGKVFEQIPAAACVLPVIERVLDPQCLLSTLSSIDIRGGESAQPIHSDDQVIGLPRTGHAVVCNSMWAITDFTEANGATRIIPGSHRNPDYPVYGEHYDSIPAEMPAGSILIWHGSLWHGGGANTTDERRVGIADNYCGGMIRQQENQQLGIPRATAAGFDKRLQRLCGYGTYNGLIGHIDKQDPLTLLDPDAEHAMLWDGA